MAAELDPNFDPLFQRGFDPAVHRTRVKPAGEPRGVTSIPLEDEIGGRSDTSAKVVEERVDEGEPAGMRRNPFLVGLLVMGAVLLAGFVVLVVNYMRVQRGQFDGPASTSDTYWLSAGSSVMPALLVGGLVCVTLWFTGRALQEARPRD